MSRIRKMSFGAEGTHVGRGCGQGGFTLIEIIIVVVILSIAAMMAIPMIGSAGTVQLHSAAEMIAADLEYAKSMAISRGHMFKVTFDSDQSYKITEEKTVNNWTDIVNPLTAKQPYLVKLHGDAHLDSVNLVSANFVSSAASGMEVWFDSLGSPWNSHNTGGALNSGEIRLSAGTNTAIKVTVTPVTGFINVTD